MYEGRMGKEEEEENGIYVGRSVKKFFLGFGYFYGKVISFNRYRKFYKVKYDDGDREELDLKELKEVLVDADCQEQEQPESQPKLLLSSSSAVDKPITSGRRGRKRRRDSAEKEAISAGGGALGDGQYENPLAKNSSLRLEEVKVLNAQTKEIYRQLRGSDDGGKDGHVQGEELLLEPLVPVSLENAFEKSAKRPEFEFDPPGEDEGKRKAEAFANGNCVPGLKPSSCRRKRNRVSPTFNSCLPQQQQMPSVEDEVGARNKEGDTEKLADEKAMTIADVPLPSVGTEADSPLSDADRDLDPGKDHAGGEGHEEEKTQFSVFVLSLPPSSRNFGELDDCVVDLFQVYSLLRSFSNLIFLSPFSLEEFAYSLVSTDICALTDSIHLSLLQTLRRQLERLSKNGSKSATFTLRLSDWSLLDDITWPSFLVGYMLTQGFNFSRAGQSFVKSSLSTPVDYYKLPVRTKLAILSFLTDKVLDTDEARAELARRILLENDPETMETKGFAPKKQVNESTPENETLAHGMETLSPSGANAVRVGRHLDEDGNLDECVLCAMDGNLICCDGCPAAYHSRCVGVTKQGLPPGDWFCPECCANKHDPRGARISKRIRGGELLAIGPDSQFFYNICGYLLISESGPGVQVMHRYYSPRDLHTIVQLLELAGPSYSEVQDAVQQFYQVDTGIRRTREASPKAASVLEAPPSVVLSSENEAGHNAGQCNSNILLGGNVPEDVEKSVPPCGSLASEHTKTLADLPSSLMSSTAANCEPVISPVIWRSKEEHHVKQNLNASNSAKDTSGLQPTSDVVGSSTGDEEKKPRVCSNEHGKPDHDELQCGFTDKSLSSELENIWREHTCGDSQKQVILESTSSQSKEQSKFENVIQFSDPQSAGVIGVEPERIGTSAGDTEDVKMVCLGMVQHELKGDLALTTVIKPPGKPREELPEQRDEPGGLEKRPKAGHVEVGSIAREVDYLSTITQINACSYKNKYANCDLVATAAFNLAVMAGGVDDLVDDRSGSMKKSKPSSVADHVKAFTQASSPFFWPSVKKRGKDVPKEKCGWCINCRLPIRRGCLLTQVAGQMAGGAALVVGGIRSLKGGTGHFPAVAAYILYMEENLHGLLVGPWENSGHRKKWRKKVEQAKSLKDIKLALLEMESSMRKVVLSPDWDKVEEDYPESIASSAAIVNTASVPAGKKAAPTRKRGRPNVVAKPPPVNSYDGACFGVKWWRGGSLSRKVYNWESLTRTSLRRAGRQGGFKEIPELVYSKSLDLPRRTRRFAWRTRLEKISSIAQVAAEVRYLDTFIKWNDIISPLEATTTHNVKGPVESDPAVHKAEIRIKKDESGTVKYLLGFAADTDETIDASTEQQQEVPGVGASAEKPNNKKHQASAKEGANDVWATESQVPLFLLKAYLEKLRAEKQTELPKSLKKGKLKGSNQQKKLSFWNLLCNPRLAVPLENKKKPGWVCGYCNLSCSKSQHVRCQRCSGHFHKKCTQVEDSINGQEQVPVCKSCIQSRLGHRMRKPSYKMLAMQSQLLSDGIATTFSKEAVIADKEEISLGRKKLKCKRDRPDSTSPPDSKLFGQKKKKKLLSLPTPSQLDCESIWMEKKGKKKKKMKKKGFTTVFPCQYDGEPTRLGKKKPKKIALPVEEEDTDLPQPKKRGRKRKQDTPPQEKRRSGRIVSVSSSPLQAERKDDTPRQERRRSGRIRSASSSPSQAERNEDTVLQERRTSGRIRNSISPNAPNSLSITELRQVPRRYKKKYKLDEESSKKPMSRKGRIGLRMDSFEAPQNDDDDDDEVVIKLPVKRKRLKIIFDGLEVRRQDVNNNGGPDEGRQRKSGNGLDFGTRSVKSEAEIQKFRQERVVLEDQMGLDGEKLPRCGICSEPHAPGHVYVSCEYCEGWYHGAAVGLRQVDAPYLVGYKCHRCRKCRAPACPFRQNGEVKLRGAVDYGEVIDAENLNRTGQGQLESVSLQSSWFSSPDKDFSAAFSDAKAFPDFVAATNQAEEALAADGSNFGHDVLSNDFDMSNLVLAGDSQVQLNPLSLEDQQVNVWTDNESSQLHLRSFSVSQTDISPDAAPPLSFTELLASEDDLFEGVAGPGLLLSAEWSRGMYGAGSLVPLKPPPAGLTTNAGVDNYSSFVNANGTTSSGSGTLANPHRAPATDTARIGDYSSFASINGTACQTTVPLKQCENYSYIEQSAPLSLMNGDKEQGMNRGTPSAAR